MRPQAVWTKMRVAYGVEDWERVVELGESLLASELPEPLQAPVSFLTARALFTLGQNRRALEHFEAGFRAPQPPDAVDVTEFAYFAGMAAMMEGDLERARFHLREAIARGREGVWAVNAAYRGVAQVETELGYFDEAIASLQQLLARGDDNPMTRLLLARASARAGDAATARHHLSIGVWLMADPEPNSPPSLFMTIASACVSAAETYLELGHAAEAHQMLDATEGALAEAAWPDIPAAAYLKVFRASALRLDGRLDEAAERLEAIAGQTHSAEDVRPMLARERARVAHLRGDAEQAKSLWNEAAAGFDAIGYRQQAESTRREITSGPPVSVPFPEPLEGEAAAGVELPDGVIVTLTIGEEEGSEQDAQAGLEIAHAIEDALIAAEVGEYDGWEVGGGTFSIYCYGEPEKMWPVIAAVLRERGVEEGMVLLRQGDEERTFRLEARE